MSDPTYEQPVSDDGEPGPDGGGTGTGPACTACGGTSLEPGFIEDRGQGSQGYARWVAGQLQRGIFGGAFRMGKEKSSIEAWRCTACGHLDLYARSAG